MEVDFTEKIKNVFDVCDSEGTGYITVDHLKELARDHFGADSDEETIGIIQLLDPEGKGKVNFSDFCKGVQQILEVQAQSAQAKQSTPADPDHQIFSSFHYTEESSNEAQDNSEASAFTFNEYDTTTDEDQNLLIDLSSTETPRRNLFPAHGQSSGRSSVNSKTDEENFEDFGVVDLESDSSDANLSCDSCHRSRGSSRHRHRHKGPHRRISSAGKARTLSPFHQPCPFDIATPSPLQLQKGVFSPSEDIYDDIDGSFQELTDRIKGLEKQLAKVSEEKTGADGISHRYKDENSILIKSVVDRIHTMEEQLKDMEVKSDERLKEEKRKYNEIVNKSGVEMQKMDYLTMRLQTVESENEKLKTDTNRLKNDNDKLRSDKLELKDQLSAVMEDYNRVSAEYTDCKARLERQQVMTAGGSSAQMLDELQKELEDLRNYKIECERKHSALNRSVSLSDSNGYGSPLQAEMAKLKETLWSEWQVAAKTNRNLKEENEELSAQLLAQAVREGKHMLQEGSSLADELDHMTKEELMDALKKEQEANFRIRQYLDKLIITILEKNPSMLEIH